MSMSSASTSSVPEPLGKDQVLDEHQMRMDAAMRTVLDDPEIQRNIANSSIAMLFEDMRRLRADMEKAMACGTQEAMIKELRASLSHGK